MPPARESGSLTEPPNKTPSGGCGPMGFGTPPEMVAWAFASNSYLDFGINMDLDSGLTSFFATGRSSGLVASNWATVGGALEQLRPF